jgi:hypothetical protein
VHLKPQDVLLLLKLAVREGKDFSYAELADELGMGASEVHGAVRRGREAIIDPVLRALQAIRSVGAARSSPRPPIGRESE